ncbi:reverse transcriptase domain-containing protein [Tanacetum coccineum]
MLVFVVNGYRSEMRQRRIREALEVKLERLRHLVMPEDIPEPAQEGAVEVTYETLGDLVQRKIPAPNLSPSMTPEELKNWLRSPSENEEIEYVRNGNEKTGNGNRNGIMNEIQKMETELVESDRERKRLTATRKGFRVMILLCTRIVPRKKTSERFNEKVQGYAARSAENKRRMESNLRDNRGQQPPFKRQNTSGQNVARAYTAGNNERKGYVGFLPYCNKCRLHHEGLCTMRCGNCKKVGHQTRECRAAIAPNTQRAPVGNQQGIICYECGRPGHFRRDCPKLRNQNRGNQTRNKNGNKTGGNETTARAYAIGGGGTNPDSNVVTGKYGDSDGYTFDDPILILEILSRRFLLRGIYLITGSSKDGDGDTSFQWSQFTTQCSHLMFPSKDIMTTE